MSTIVIGIDPGVHGAIGVIAPNGSFVYDMPTYKKGKRLRTCDATLSEELDSLREKHLRPFETIAQCEIKIHAFVELVHSMPGQGVASMFSFGESFGIIRGVLAALDIPYELVTPQSWKRAMGVPRGDKKGSVSVAIRLFPKLTRDLTWEKRGGTSPAENLTGRADALLIAEYGRRLLGSTM